ncbi:prestin [Anabrus simplex]|uniref:prestin n=1 Tax=Anabrus simplex TaxID=316456 RepID=UPI0035A358C6
MADNPISGQESIPDEYDTVINGLTPLKSHPGDHPCKQAEFDKRFQYSKPRKQALRKRIVKWKCSSPLNSVLSLFPILTWLPNYQWRKDLFSDIISGFTVAVMHIPQGMAYALLGNVPPIVGLYMAFFPVLLYIIMGTSRHVSMGTFAVVCMMSSKPITLYSTSEAPDHSLNSSADVLNNSNTYDGASTFNGTTEYTAVQVATILCFAVGIWQVLLGMFQLGVLSVLLSDTLVSGFTTGASIQVLTTQVKNIFGVKLPRRNGPLKVIYTYIDLVRNIHTTNFMALGISAAFIVVLTIYNELIKPRISKKLPIPLPVELLAIIAGTLISMFCHLESDFKVATIGEIPTGLPYPSPPPFLLLPNVLMDGLVIAIVAFSVNMSMSSIFARKLNYSVDANQELLASGFSNIFGSFFSCIPFGASLSRSLIQQTVGGKTQLASLVSCVLLLLVLLVIGPFFEPLPNCVLASIILVALKGMLMQMKDLRSIWRHSSWDGAVWLVTFLSVIILDIDFGLGIGVALSLLCVLIMGQRPKMCFLGNVPSTDIYLDIRRYQSAVEIPGICIIQVAGGLHFANKEHVSRKLHHMISEKEKSYAQVDSDGQIKCVILDMTSVCFMDPSAIKSLITIYKDLEVKGMLFCLADCSATVYERMVHCDFFESFSDSHLFPTVHDAVLFAKQAVCEGNGVICTTD